MATSTWTVVGLINAAGDELYVAGVFGGMQRNCDTNVDAQVRGEVMDQFVGFFDAETADDAAELARDMITNPLQATTRAPRPKSRTVTTAQVRSNVL